jgi:hypothetical protein
MWGKVIVSQIFAIPSAWAATAALMQLFTNIPWYVPVGTWALVSLYALAKLK